MNKSDYNKYYKKGGTYVIPVEIFNDLCEELEEQERHIKEADFEIERLNNIINKALEKSKGLQYRFGYVLDDLIYLLMQRCLVQ